MILLSHDYCGLAEWCWGSSPSHPARDQSRYTPSNQGFPIVPKLIACIEDQGHMGLSENRSYQNFMVFTVFLFKIAILGGIPVIYIFSDTPKYIPDTVCRTDCPSALRKKRAACHRFCSPIHIEVAAIPIHIAQISLLVAPIPLFVVSKLQCLMMFVGYCTLQQSGRKLSMSIDVYRLQESNQVGSHWFLRPGAAKHLRRSIHMAGLNLRWPSGLAHLSSRIYSIWMSQR